MSARVSINNVMDKVLPCARAFYFTLIKLLRQKRNKLVSVVGISEDKIVENLRRLALDCLGISKGVVVFDRGFDFIFERKFKNGKELIIQFYWYYRKEEIILQDVLEDGVSKHEQYEQGKYEKEPFVRSHLKSVNLCYEERLKRAGLINYVRAFRGS